MLLRQDVVALRPVPAKERRIHARAYFELYENWFGTFYAFPQAMTGEGANLGPSIRGVLDDPYFDCIELTRINNPAQRAQVADWVRQSGITMTYGAQPQLLRNQENLNTLDEAARKRAVDRMRACVDEAYELGAQGFAFLAGKYDPQKVEEHYQALVQSASEICDHAAAQGNMPVNLEVFDYDVEKFSLIGPTSIAQRFAGEMRQKYPQFGIMLDLSHITQLHESMDACIDPMVPYLRHVHIANAVLEAGPPAYGDQHPRFGFGHDTVDKAVLVQFLRKLFAVGYLAEGKRPIVSFEVKPWEGEDSELVLANAKRFLQDAWAQV